MMKVCTLCKEEYTIESFNKNKTKPDGFSNVCKLCSRKKSKLYYSKNPSKHKSAVKLRRDLFRQLAKDEINDFKQISGCNKCGENDPVCLDFHHIDPTLKVDNIASICTTGNIIRVREEMQKCIVLCSNCHRKLHSKL